MTWWAVGFSVLLAACWLVSSWVMIQAARAQYEKIAELMDLARSHSGDLKAECQSDKWVPAIVNSGLLKPGWLTVDADDGTFYHWWGGYEPIFDGNEWLAGHEEDDDKYDSLCLNEWPRIVGREAIWKIPRKEGA